MQQFGNSLLASVWVLAQKLRGSMTRALVNSATQAQKNSCELQRIFYL